MNKVLLFVVGILLTSTSNCFAGSVKIASANIHNDEIELKDVLLETTSNKATLDMKVVLDNLKVPSSNEVKFTPVLKGSNGQERRFKTVSIAGRRQNIIYQREPKTSSSLTVIRRLNDKPQTEAYSDMIDYEPWMENATLAIEDEACGCCKTLSNGSKDVAQLKEEVKMPDIWTLFRYGVPKAPEAKEYTLHGTAYINFIVDKWDVVPTYMNNPREIRKITDTLDIMVADENITVKKIQIHGYASPESPYAHNKMLATNRAQSLTDYIKAFYKLPADVFAKAEATPENWGDLRDSLNDNRYPIKDREGVKAIVDQVLALSEAEKANQCDNLEAKIKKQYPETYKYLLKNIYPHLRRSDYEVTFNVRSFTAEEAAKMVTRNPAYLSDNEIVGLANRQLQAGDTALSANYLSHASKECAEAENARGVLEAIKGNYDAAEKYFLSAKQKGYADADYNLSVLKEKKEPLPNPLLKEREN